MAILPHSSLIGRPVLRKEDARLVAGKGRYSDDFNLPDQAYACFVRSPHACARIHSLQIEDSRSAPGVLAVFVGSDIAAAKLNPIPHDHAFIGKPEQMRLAPDVVLINKDGTPFRVPQHTLLPVDTVRFVGEAVAMVVAESASAAKDAAELIAVEYEALPAVFDALDAIKPDAPRLWAEIPENLCVDAEVGNEVATNAAFATAPYVVSLRTHIQRVTGVTMEPRSATGSFDSATGKYSLYAGSSGVVRHKIELAAILGVPDNMVRVQADDVGGNFGTRNNFYPEFGLVVWASRQIGRPVKWTAERQESFLSDYQGRDLHVTAELALDRDGRFLAVRSDNISNIGAYFASFQPLRKGMGLMSNVYDIPVAHVRGRAVLTNTVCTTPFRSAGRPEAIFVIERLIDMAAQKFGFDRVALRKKNLIHVDNFPYRNPLTLVYDSGDYNQTLDAALRLIDWEHFESRRKAAKVRNRRRGIGIANYVEITTGVPREKAEVSIDAENGVKVVIGTMSSGQGHETSFSQITAEWLGVPIDKVSIVTGDTDIVTVGGGSISGRSMRFASVVIRRAIDDILSHAREIVSYISGVSPDSIEFIDGHFVCHNQTRQYGIFEVAAIAASDEALPQGLRKPLYGECDHLFREAGFPYGTQACEVEVDLETGQVEIVDIAAVDDVGRAINPLILHGQTVGGAVQGLGQAMMERVHYDQDTGQMLTGSLMDYALPRASAMPSFKVELTEYPSPTNALGIRAGGEGGTTPALASYVNAVVDALKEFGVEHLEMPITSERVWAAISH